MASSPDWSSLPGELILLIYHQLPFLPDHLHFRGVCRSWRSAATSSPLPPQPPLLLLPSLTSFLPPPYSSPKPLLLPPGLHLYSTSHSLLLAVSLHPVPSLLNPITSTLSPLPPLTTLPILSFHQDHYSILPENSSAPPLRRSPAFIRDSFIRKAVFSDGRLALSVHYAASKLFVSRPGDTHWSPVVPTALSGLPIIDFAWWMGHLYAVDSDGRVAECCCEVGKPVPAIKPGGYLVEGGGGELFQVRKQDVRGEERRWRQCFEVWRLEAAEERWERVESIGERRALFWCGWNWMVVDCGGRWGRDSCVFYPYVSGGEDYRRRGYVGYDLAVYHLRDGSMQMLTFDWNGEFQDQLAAWFVPMLD